MSKISRFAVYDEYLEVSLNILIIAYYVLFIIMLHI